VTSLPSHARACIVFRRSVDGSRGDRLGTGLQSIQSSPYHAGLAGLRGLRLLCASCFAAMLWSLLPVSAPVRRLTFGTFLRFPTRFSGIRFELSRRTARHERTLAAVACTPWLGCWLPTRVPWPPGDRPPPPTRAPPWPQDAATPGGPWTMSADAVQGTRGRVCGTTGPWTTAWQRDAPRRLPGTAGARRGLLPHPPPPDPVESPQAAQETPPIPWRRTRRHPTMARPCPRCR